MLPFDSMVPLQQLARVTASLALLTIVFGSLERLVPLHPRRFFRKQTGVDLIYFFLNSLLPAFLLAFPTSILATVVGRWVPASVVGFTNEWPFWGKTLAGLVVGEVGYYWGHRLSHEWPFLWRFHSIHHSAEQMDYLVSSRGHPLDVVFGKFCSLVPIYFLGLTSQTPTGDVEFIALLAQIFGTFWNFFIHANVRWRLGPLEWIIASPAFHHWHHTRTGPINRNYSATLPWVDWIFGSLLLPREWPTDYGIKMPISESIIEQLTLPVFGEVVSSASSATSADSDTESTPGPRRTS